MPGRCNSQIFLLEALTSDHSIASLLLPRFSMEVLCSFYIIIYAHECQLLSDLFDRERLSLGTTILWKRIPWSM